MASKTNACRLVAAWLLYLVIPILFVEIGQALQTNRMLQVRVTPCTSATGPSRLWTSVNPRIDLEARPIGQTGDETYQVSLAARSPAHIVVTAPGCAAVSRIVDQSDRVAALELPLSNGRDVAFRIQDGDGPVPGSVERRVGAVLVVASADEDGQGMLRGLGLEAEQLIGRFEEVSVTVTVSRTQGSITLTVPASGSISGRVLNDRGQSMPGATLAMIRNRVQSVAINDRGVFSAEQLAGGSYTLEVSAEGFRSQSLEVLLEKRQRANIAIRLVPAAQVIVRFVNLAGEPVPKPRLEVESNNAVGFEVVDMLRPRRTYTGDLGGTVTIRDLPVGLTQLVLSSPPYARLRLPPLDVLEGAPEIDLGTIVVGEGASLIATVKDRAGDPRPGVRVQIDRGPGVSPIVPDVSETDADGQAEIRRLGLGSYRVRVGGDERPGGTGPFAEEWLRVSPADSSIERTFVIGGVPLHVTASTQSGPLAFKQIALMPGVGDEPLPVEGFVVQTPSRLINAPFNPGVRSTTDQSGQATLTDTPSGPGRLSIEVSRSRWSTPITVGNTESYVSLSVPPLNVAVVVRDSDTGDPISARAVWKAHGTGIRVTASTDATGKAVFEGVAEERSSLEIESRDYRPVTLELPVGSAMPAEVLMQRSLQPSLSIQLIGTDSTLVSGASAELVQVGARRWKRVAVSREDGTLRFSGLERARARLVVRHPLFATSAIDVDVNGSSAISLQLQVGHRALLQIADEESGRQGSMSVSLFRKQGSALTEVFEDVQPRLATPGSEVELGLLAAGTYRVVLGRPGKSDSCDFEVRSTALNIRCPE